MNETTDTTTTDQDRPSRRFAAVSLAALGALAVGVGAYVISADAATPVPAPTAVVAQPATASADAAERWAQADQERLIELCRTSAVAPDSLERCMRRGG